MFWRPSEGTTAVIILACLTGSLIHAYDNGKDKMAWYRNNLTWMAWFCLVIVEELTGFPPLDVRIGLPWWFSITLVVLYVTAYVFIFQAGRRRSAVLPLDAEPIAVAEVEPEEPRKR
jgi:hypothetical protein